MKNKCIFFKNKAMKLFKLKQNRVFISILTFFIFLLNFTGVYAGDFFQSTYEANSQVALALFPLKFIGYACFFVIFSLLFAKKIISRNLFMLIVLIYTVIFYDLFYRFDSFFTIFNLGIDFREKAQSLFILFVFLLLIFNLMLFFRSKKISKKLKYILSFFWLAIFFILFYSSIISINFSDEYLINYLQSNLQQFLLIFFFLNYLLLAASLVVNILLDYDFTFSKRLLNLFNFQDFTLHIKFPLKLFIKLPSSLKFVKFLLKLPIVIFSNLLFLIGFSSAWNFLPETLIYIANQIDNNDIFTSLIRGYIKIFFGAPLSTNFMVCGIIFWYLFLNLFFRNKNKPAGKNQKIIATVLIAWLVFSIVLSFLAFSLFSNIYKEIQHEFQ